MWRRFVEKHTPDTVEVHLEPAGSTPLFDVQLKVVTGDDTKPCVSIVPGLPEIKSALMCIIDDVVAAVKVRHLRWWDALEHPTHQMLESG